MDQWNTTYAPTGAFLKRNATDDTVAGLTPMGQQTMGAFGAALQGAGAAMANPQASPAQQFTGGMRAYQAPTERMGGGDLMAHWRDQLRQRRDALYPGKAGAFSE